MISVGETTAHLSSERRILVVGDPEGSRGLAADLRRHHEGWSVASCDTYLSGIAELTQHAASAVLAFVDPAISELGHAVAGLREAAGRDVKVVLCCRPECEPMTRSALGDGADDYILCPLDRDEVDEAIGITHVVVSSDPRLTTAPSASLDEFVQLAGVLAHLGDTPVSVLERVAELVRRALQARGATLVIEGAVATAGETTPEPVLTAPLAGQGGLLGQLSLAQRQSGAYTPSDAQKLTHYAAVVGHILGAASLQRQWRKLAVTDECSGMPNRRYFNERVDDILSRAATDRFHVTVLLFDVDNFKSYNDRFGHDAGDEVIRVVGTLFQQHCREQDVVARYGGDEFAVCFWDPEGPRAAGSKVPDSALSVLDRFKEALQTHSFPALGPSGSGQLTISGGVATYPWDGTTREQLLKQADDALLAAKRAGKNRIFSIGEQDGTPHVAG